MYQSNPVGVELFSYVRTFVGVMLQILCTEIYASEVKLYISSFDLFSKKQRWFSPKRRIHNTQPNYSFLCEKSDMSVRFLNAINIDFHL